MRLEKWELSSPTIMDLQQSLNIFDRKFAQDTQDSLDKTVHYDVVQVRGCGRGVSAKNAVSFVPVGNNSVGSYALGGIGMTCMLPNAELGVQYLEYLEGSGVGDLGTGQIGNETVLNKVYVKHVLTGIDYSTLVDDDLRVGRMLGVNDSFSPAEGLMLWGILGLGCAVGLFGLLSLKQKKKVVLRNKPVPNEGSTTEYFPFLTPRLVPRFESEESKRTQ